MLAVTSPCSRSLTDDLEHIRALERKLHISGKRKLPASFEEDGLATLLEGLSDTEGKAGAPGSVKRPRAKEPSPPRATNQHAALEPQSPSPWTDPKCHHQRAGSRDAKQLQLGLLACQHTCATSQNDAVEAANIRRAPSPTTEPLKSRDSRAATADVRNPYAPPACKETGQSECSRTALLRRIQGLLNKLSNQNLHNTITVWEELRKSASGKRLTEIALDLIISRTAVPQRLDEGYITLLGGFCAALYHMHGPSFGVRVLQRIASLFETGLCAQEESDKVDKILPNLISLTQALFVFEIVGCDFLYGMLRRLLKKPDMENMELVHKILRGMSEIGTPLLWR